VSDNPLSAMRAMGPKTIQMSSHYTHVGVDGEGGVEAAGLMTPMLVDRCRLA